MISFDILRPIPWLNTQMVQMIIDEITNLPIEKDKGKV